MTEPSLRQTVCNRIEHHLAVASSIYALKVSHGYVSNHKMVELNKSVKAVIKHCNFLKHEPTKRTIPEHPCWPAYLSLAAYESTKPSPDIGYILECCIKIKKVKNIK